jgi:hypothetical protein
VNKDLLSIEGVRQSIKSTEVLLEYNASSIPLRFSQALLKLLFLECIINLIHNARPNAFIDSHSGTYEHRKAYLHESSFAEQ